MLALVLCLLFIFAVLGSFVWSIVITFKESPSALDREAQWPGLPMTMLLLLNAISHVLNLMIEHRHVPYDPTGSSQLNPLWILAAAILILLACVVAPLLLRRAIRTSGGVGATLFVLVCAYLPMVVSVVLAFKDKVDLSSWILSIVPVFLAVICWCVYRSERNGLSGRDPWSSLNRKLADEEPPRMAPRPAPVAPAPVIATPHRMDLSARRSTALLLPRPAELACGLTHPGSNRPTLVIATVPCRERDSVELYRSAPADEDITAVTAGPWSWPS